MSDCNECLTGHIEYGIRLIRTGGCESTYVEWEGCSYCEYYEESEQTED